MSKLYSVKLCFLSIQNLFSQKKSKEKRTLKNSVFFGFYLLSRLEFGIVKGKQMLKINNFKIFCGTLKKSKNL